MPVNRDLAPARERDACGILGGLTREPRPLAGFARMLESLGHRGGDGVGIHFRVSREVLERELATASHRAAGVTVVPEEGGPLVLMLQIPCAVSGHRALACTREVLKHQGLGLVYAHPVSRPTRDGEQVRTWRLVASDAAPAGARRLAERVLAARRDLEARAGADGLPDSFFPASFSTEGMCLYKQVGSVDDWFESFGRETIAALETDCFIAHVRYSTNTLPRHRSAQPFGHLAHNGEINNIGALRRTMQERGVPTSRASSDSSDLDALIEELCVRHQLTLPEALQMVFPRRWLRDAGTGAREWHAGLARATRSVRAEGPAALVASDGRCLVGRLDSLGLRPLALVETREGDVYFASEPGAVGPPEELARVHQLRPGEMLAVSRDGDGLRLAGDAELEADMRERGRVVTVPLRQSVAREATAPARPARFPLDLRRSVAGYSPRARRQIEALFLDGKEVGSGTGWRGGLAVARGIGARFADHLHAMTAQVTAPTLSAEHEMAAMDARLVLGAAPSLALAKHEVPGVALDLPFVLDAEDPEAAPVLEDAARRLGVSTLSSLRESAGAALVEIDARVDAHELRADDDGAAHVRSALDRIRDEAGALALAGESPLLLLRCTWGRDCDRAPLPPELAVAAVDHELVRRGLRGRVSLLVASETLSDAHGCFVSLQCGADALVPGLLCEEVLALAERSRRPPAETLERGFAAMTRALLIMYGRIATSEIAAGRGGRRFCAVGLDAEIRDAMGVVSGLGEGLDLAGLWRGLHVRSRAMSGCERALAELAETPVDTMPLDAALGSFALLGGFEPAPGRSPRGAGQVRIAARVLGESLERQHLAQHEIGVAVPPTPGADGEAGQRLLRWVAALPVERRAELHHALFAPLRAGRFGFLDSLALAGPGSGEGDWKAVGSGLDGRRNNQILGAISYGANNRVVHELYALVMARCGAMSNGGEGGVPDHVRALFVTARLAARGAGAAGLARQLAEEVPSYLQGIGRDEREALCRRLLRIVPDDFAASRFEQISTARFGVDAYAFHDTRFLEIKIGQGAKPGVGGSLPGDKVLPAIAATRGVNVGQTLNSPTVHHDIYSIEDLRQLVTALKTLHPAARVCVKLAAMDDVDVIALGVVKAGADFIWIDGYEGGTGSAKDAHKEHCGLPAAPVLRQVHETLQAEGLRGAYRHEEEPRWVTRRAFRRLPREEQTHYRWHGPRIVGSGGVRHAEDALKLILCGADYVGYGDAAQNAVGCIRCEKCHTGRCPSFVATNDPRRSEAFDAATGESTLTAFVELVDVGLRKLALGLAPGVRHLEELVGRTDLLCPADGARLRVDSGFFEPVAEPDPPAPFPLDPGGDARAVRRAPARGLDAAFARWRCEIEERLHEQGLAIDDPNALAGVEPGSLELPDALRRLEVQVEVDNRDRLLGTGLVRSFVSLRRLVRIATGIPIELAIRARGAVGSGFGMFAVHGMDLVVMGQGGDYLGEAVNGARIFVLPARTPDGGLLPGSGAAGNASVYGMRGGEVHLFDQPGTRFGIRVSGGNVFVWGDPASVEASFAPDAVKPQFTGEYMTRGTLVLCRDPGLNLLCAATGRHTEILCRKPEASGREDWRRELAGRVPPGFEVVSIAARHAALIERGARDYRRRARAEGITRAVTPLRPGEDLRESFLLLRERREES